MEDAKKMTVNQLKEELKKRNASIQGNKPELYARLVELIETQETSETGDESTRMIENEVTTESNQVNVSTIVPVSSLDVEMVEIQQQKSEVSVPASEENETRLDSAKETNDNPISAQPESVGSSAINDGSEVNEAESTNIPSVESAPADSVPTMKPENSNPMEEESQENNDQALSLGEKIRQNIKKRKDRENPDEDQPETKSSQKKTNFVRIDNFQRPLNVKSLVKWLTETIGTNITEEMIWINTIKTHCYIDFSSVEEAENCINKITGLKYPATSTNLLSGHFTTVSVKDAPTSPEAALKPGEWLNARNKKPQSNNNNNNNPKKNQKIEEEDGNSKSNPSSTNIVGANLFKRATSSALTVSNPNLQIKMSNTKSRTVTLSTSSTQQPTADIEEKKENPNAAKNSHNLKQNENLRKTETQPPIYWLPVDEEIAERRRSLKNRLGSKKARVINTNQNKR